MTLRSVLVHPYCTWTPLESSCEGSRHEQTRRDVNPIIVRVLVCMQTELATVFGTVTDPSGAVIPYWLMLMSLLFAALLLAIGAMFSQMESDPILGKLEDAEASAGSSFFRAAGKLLSVGGVPLLAVLASQFPAFAEMISRWIKPVSEALH